MVENRRSDNHRPTRRSNNDSSGQRGNSARRNSTDSRGRDSWERSSSERRGAASFSSDRPHRGEERRDTRGGGNTSDSRRHAQRGGRDRENERRFNPQRAGYREERINKRLSEPDLPDDIDITYLDPMVLQDLRVLSKQNADGVAKHMFMAATLMEDDPQLALRHARAAKERAGRVGVVRETNGIIAYRAGEWKEALSELRAARRMSGGPGLLAVMADAERGLGRPQKAIELGQSEDAAQLDPDSRIELAIVVAGARTDLGQLESALVTLERMNPDKNSSSMAGIRLNYAYADALLNLGRKDDAREWFQAVADVDKDGYTDAEERLKTL
ncbi:tetratricopeptide repeat protein [Corynebacterium caspium]|uniref:tetratricopeptide repeat protein n=1 Tax=Corynebacterium caspium TaxID=234828 RepID=UPI00037CE540|nr:tetratricopeptide repeat protein [Corynebacterium caspium]WKD59356.1 hypothetical protein CCASP_04805 [Corynebacterium caspium DSM 44850]